MFDIGATELLLIVVVAILAIGPKDMPAALRAAGRWIGKARRMSNHFRSGIDAMIREAEIEDMERKWAEQNKRIMAEHPDVPKEVEPAKPADPAQSDPADSAAAEARARVRPPTDASCEPSADSETSQHRETTPRDQHADRSDG